VGLLSHCRTPYAKIMCFKYLAYSLPNFSIVTPYTEELCEYVFPIGFPLYVPKNGVLEGGGLRVKMLKYRVYASASVSRVKIGETV